MTPIYQMNQLSACEQASEPDAWMGSRVFWKDAQKPVKGFPNIVTLGPRVRELRF